MPWGTYGSYTEYMANVTSGTITDEELAQQASDFMEAFSQGGYEYGSLVPFTLSLSEDGVNWDDYAAEGTMANVTYPRLNNIQCEDLELTGGDFRIQTNYSQEFLNVAQIGNYLYAKISITIPGSVVYYKIDGNYIPVDGTTIGLNGSNELECLVDTSDLVTLSDAQTITGVKTFANEGIKVIGEDLGTVALKGPTANSAYTAKFPNKSGTVAMTSDIPSVPVTDVTLGGTSVLSSGVAVLPAYPTVPVTDVTVDGTSVVSSGTAAITMPTIPTSLPVETLTTAPSEAYTGPGLKVVYLSSEPATKYAGYIYMIAES